MVRKYELAEKQLCVKNDKLDKMRRQRHMNKGVGHLASNFTGKN